MSLKVNFASNNTAKHVYFTFFCSRMEKHAAFLAKRCRLCGKNLLTLKTVQNCEKTVPGSDLLNFIYKDIELDSREIHPTAHLLVAYGNRREQEGADVIFVTPTITIIRSLDWHQEWWIVLCSKYWPYFREEHHPHYPQSSPFWVQCKGGFRRTKIKMKTTKYC